MEIVFTSNDEAMWVSPLSQPIYKEDLLITAAIERIVGAVFTVTVPGYSFFEVGGTKDII